MIVYPCLENDTKKIESFEVKTFLTFFFFAGSDRIPSILVVEWAAFSPIGLNHGFFKQKFKAFRSN